MIKQLEKLNGRGRGREGPLHSRERTALRKTSGEQYGRHPGRAKHHMYVPKYLHSRRWMDHANIIHYLK